MEAVLLCSKVVPRGLRLEDNRKFSFRHLNKHLKCNSLRADSRNSPLLRTFESIKSPFTVRKGSWVPTRCSISTSTVSDSDNPFFSQFNNFSFGSLVDKVRHLKLKPMDVVKLTLLVSILTVAAKKVVNLVLDPFFWMYFSWTWLFWPWFIALGLAGYGVYCFRKHWLGEANAFEQLGIVTSFFTWLTLVPPAYFNGYLEGWPFVFFLAYHYFFFFNVSVRKRLYGDYYARTHDPKWDVNTPLWSRVFFGVGIMVGHWLAAFEGPELHRLPGGWVNVGIWVLTVITMLMHYDSTLYLARYSEKVVVPTAVVQFGPYRWVRHPIYASMMLLFATYCTALHAPLSLLFLVSVCLVYYSKKAKMEEDLMVESFGQSYSDYADKPVVADAASLRFTSDVVSFVFISRSKIKGSFSNGNLDDAASANTWLLLSTFSPFSNEERYVKDALEVSQGLKTHKDPKKLRTSTLDSMDDANLWKVSKRDSIIETTSHFSSKPVFTRSFSTKTSSSSSSSKPIFTRSFSTKPTSYSSSESIFRRSFSAKPTSSKSPILSRSCSTKCPAAGTTSGSKCSVPRSLSQKGASVTRKCRNMAKEHKSRFYIMKRCVLMLVCWHKHA